MATVDHRILRNISLDSTNVDEEDEMILNNHVCTHVPKDRFNSVYASLVLAGIGFLLPYNSFITAVDYFHSQYPGSTIVFDMSLTYIVIAFAAVLLNNFLVETLSFTFRISFGYVVAFFSLIMIAIFEIGLSMFSDGTSYVIVLIAVAIVSFGCTVQQSSYYGYAGMLPRKYTQAVMTGESAAGLLTSLIRIITKLVLHNERINTLLFFIFSSIVILVCFVTYHTSRNSDFVRYHVAICSKDARSTADGFQVMTEEEQLVNDVVTDGGTMINAVGGDENGDEGLDVDGSRYRYVKFNGQNSFELEYEQPASHNTKCNSIKMSIMKRYRLAKSVWPYMLSIALAYFVTLCLFPGIESEVINCSLGDWMPIIIMAIFNATDLIGKLLAAIPYAWKPKYLLIAASSRAVLIPLMILCVIPRRAPTLSSSVWAMIFSALLGVTNGYFGSLPMIIAPTTVPDEKRELTGNIMTISYNVGLTSGSAFAYFFRDLIGPAVNLCTSTYLIKKLPV
ncbi:equilibrative nucleoside transporter 4-like [Anneissia japonica]|uniref:equilibrative nucleoside transporter 4-like n=1 Tax=Anneissia japonica TaxID=1529436 RepID=UPI0014259AE9|nr:equilibrative nucleoside transporter 4-like [Anneissia japonica]XP_033122170.1 equilibrative nucleoside transporter 4-like [Anneissia japonica]